MYFGVLYFLILNITWFCRSDFAVGVELTVVIYVYYAVVSQCAENQSFDGGGRLVKNC